MFYKNYAVAPNPKMPVRKLNSRKPRTLCATARGDNTLAVFDIAPDGRLTLRQLIALDGRTPRDFNAFGDALVVALQDSGRVVVYRKDAGGLYQKTDAEMPAVKPTCVAKL